MKSNQLLNFKRFRASKVFRCCDCGEAIEIGSYYWRMYSLYKYCDTCYILRLNRHGWGIAESHSPSKTKGYSIDRFWYARKDRSLETQLALFQ